MIDDADLRRALRSAGFAPFSPTGDKAREYISAGHASTIAEAVSLAATWNRNEREQRRRELEHETGATW